MSQSSVTALPSGASWVELEQIVESKVGLLEPGSVTAFALEHEGFGLALEVPTGIAEVIRPEALGDAVAEALLEESHAAPAVIVLSPARALPSGGDARRKECARRWRAGELAGWATLREGRLVPDSSRAAGAAADAPSPGSTEQALADLWIEVLGVPAVARDSGFFALGGNSLAAARVAARVQERFGVMLPASALFDAPTLAGLAAVIEAMSATATPVEPIPRISRSARLPLSAAQSRMRWLWQLAPESAAYNIGGVLRLSGELDRRALQRTFDGLIERHEALRTRFPEHEGQPYQHIDAPHPLQLVEHDLSGQRQGERAARELLAREAAAPFDLEHGPLLRVSLVRLGEDEHLLGVTLHHAIADGASMNLLIREFALSYSAFCRGQAPALPPPALQYADYAHWQAERLAQGEAERQLEYWQRELAGVPALASLPGDRPRPPTQSARGGRVELALEPSLVQRLRALTARQNASLFSVLFSAFRVLLFQYTDQADMPLGVPAANRLRREAESLLGAFVNTVVLRARVRPEESFIELIERVKGLVSKAQQNQELPFERLVEKLSPERSAAYHPLFQVMFNHQQRDAAALAELPRLKVELREVESPATRFDLSLLTEEHDSGALSVAFVYAADLFDAARIERLARQFEAVLEILVRSPERPVGNAHGLGARELEQLESWSVPRRLPAAQGLVHEWITRQAELHPEACALVFERARLTYAELDGRAARFAEHLRRCGAGPETIVGVALPRCLELPVVLLGILKSGAAYLPLDPELPSGRLEYMVSDCRASLIVAGPELRSRLGALEHVGWVSPDDVRASATASPAGSSAVSASAPRPAVCGENLAYVLYTSGSTGQPKAVGNTHAALAERLRWMQREYDIGTRDTLLQKTPLGFDVSVWEVFLPLLSGARLVIAPPGAHRDPLELAQLIQRHGVTTIHFVPSLLERFVAEESAGSCTSLVRLFSGGEALSTELARAVQTRLPGVRLDNRYGPTEALINCSYWTCEPALEGPVPIGCPIPNSTLRVLGASLEPKPALVPGELYIGGAGLARGYLGRPALTAEHFVPDPFAREPGQRQYRSGDFARFRSDGALEYLGRKDAQVKLRGVRLELGEIETSLRALPGVEEALATLRPGPLGSVLVGYVVAAPEVASEGLLSLLEQRLPAQLVPSQLVRLARLPRLSSGKLDRAALPDPEWQARDYMPPESPLEAELATLWQSVLHVERVGLNDDFFALGGHSLLATQVVARVRRAHGIELPLRVLFEASGLRAFAGRVQQALDAGHASQQPELVRAPREGGLPLSYSQERMWFLWRLEPESAAYNVGGAVRLTGPLDRDALGEALTALIARHESLRTTFRESDGVPRQEVADELRLPMAFVDLSALAEADQPAAYEAHKDAEAQQPFDLERGPLLRAKLLRLAPSEHVLLVTLHHIVAEGWAMDIFAREWASLYEAKVSGAPSPLPPLTVQYPDYGPWQRRWLEAGEGARQLEYWKRQLGSEHPVLELPSDRPRPATQSFRGDYFRFALAPELSQRVRQFALRRGATLSMTLTATLFALLYRYTGQRDLRIGYPVANRVRPEFEDLIGAFLNTQVLRCEVSGELTAAELVERVKQASLAAQSHQDVPFHRIVEAVQPERSAAHLPLFQVMCNVQRWNFQQPRDVAGLRIEFITNDSRAAKCDLALDVSDVGGELACAFVYSTDLFDVATVERMARHWVRIVESMVQESSAGSGLGNAVGSTPEAAAEQPRRLSELPLLDAEERDAMLARWNPEHAASYVERPIHELVAERWQSAPDAIAVVCGDRRLNARELFQQARQLAWRLHGLGLRPEARVGIFLERSVDSVVAMLAVLEAGAAFVPLDPEYPSERLAYLLDDAGLELLITRGEPDASGLALAALPRVRVDDPSLTGEPLRPLERRIAPDQLAYLIYTSGSTGRPKGVAVAHRALGMHCQAVASIYGLDASDCALCLAALGFDASIEQILVPLVSGARVVLSSAADWSVEALCARVEAERVTLIYPPTSRIAELAAYAERHQKQLGVRRCCVGGEAVSRDTLALIQRGLSCQVTNGYGPTETVVTPLLWRTDGAAPFAGAFAPIGTAVGQRTIYVLDEHLELVAPGVLGELYIGGVGVARGYHGAPGLSADRFIPDPFSPAGGRLYRTGDLVRDRGDGCIEFVGRRDGQIKLRGYRIELGEIEARLLEHSAVADAAVVLRESQGRRRLVGYVVATPGEALSLESVKAGLARVLPDYMVPAQLVLLDGLPRTPNGKLDRKALPEPVSSEARHASAPQSPSELLLAELWRGLLQVPSVGLDDNFFELGGDSIVSLQLVHRARERGLMLQPRDVFQHQTLGALAQAASTKRVAAAAADDAQGSLPLTPVQSRFARLFQAAPHHYNQALLLRPQQALGAEPLGRALEWLASHHDALRLRIADVGADGRQRYESAEAEQRAAAEDPRLWLRSLHDAAELPGIADQAQRSLHLERGPLYRAVLLGLPDGSQRLLWVIHHLAVDGVSWRVLLEDLEMAYRALSTGKTPALPAKTSSFKRWSERLRAYAASPELEAEAAHWLAGPYAQAASDAGLRPDEPSGALLVAQRAEHRLRLDAASTQRLSKQAPSAYRCRVQDLLLCALARVLCRSSQQPAALLELESHGRDAAFEGLDLSRTVGWFTSLYPVRLTPELGADAEALGASIKAVKEQLRAVPRQGLAFGVLEELGVPEQRARLSPLPRPRVTFNYLGQYDQSFGPDALFALADEPPGQSQSGELPLGNELTVTAQISGGELGVSLAYSRAMFRAETIAELGAAYITELQALIAHCTREASAGVTPSDFPLLTASQAELDALPVPAREIEDIYPLSPLQQGLLFHSLFADDSDLYVSQLGVDIEGLDVARFRAAWQHAIDRHAILRSAFIELAPGAGLVQLVRQHVDVELREVDLRAQGSNASALAKLASLERAKRFDLAAPPLSRLVLARVDEQRWRLIWTHHHVLLDGWSSARLIEEVLRAYAGEPLAPRLSSYREFIAWLGRRDASGDEAFWKARLAALPEPTLLAAAVAPPRLPHPGHAELRISITREQSHALRELARREHVTLSTVFQAAWSLLLQRYTGQQTVAFGVTVSGRPPELPGVDGVLGLFINTLPLIQRPRPDQALGAWLRELLEENVALREHEHTALLDVQRWAGRAGQALFDTLLVFENYPVDRALHGGEKAGLRFDQVQSIDRTNYALTLEVDDRAELGVSFKYSRAQLDPELLATLAHELEHLLLDMARCPDRRLGELVLAARGEPRHLGRPLSDVGPWLPQRIEAHAERTPDRIALQHPRGSLSYGELNARANQLAHGLRARGVGPDVLVGVCLERSLEMVVALLAIVKAGGAYVPLDPSYPEARLRYMMEDSGMRLVLTREGLLEPASSAAVVLFCLDRDGHEIAREPRTNPAGVSHGQELVYCIYTSGSSGRPKGAALTHHGLASYLCWALEAYRMHELEGSALHSSIAFDLSVTSLWLPLCAGKRVELCADDQDPIEALRATLTQTGGAGLLKLTPSHALALASSIDAPLPGVRALVVGGEALSWECVEALGRLAPGARVINEYGPTETVVGCCIHEAALAQRAGASDSVPIGLPIDNIQLYIVDACFRLLPPGVPGELCIAGGALARGYHGRPGLSAERFVPNPFDSQPGQRLYRTGDLARYGRDGVIEYLGRLDQQVKIRGYRIELGEIEARLQEHPRIAQAAVLAQPGPAGKQLIAYGVVAQGSTAPEAALEQELTLALRAQLPEYMLPARFVWLERLPLTTNGKLDRAALPAPDWSPRQEFAPPEGEREQQLAEIWRAVLHLERVGRDDNFFDLGGDSIVSLQVASRARQRGLALSPRDVFQHQTIRSLAAALRGANEAAPASVHPAAAHEAALQQPARHRATPSTELPLIRLSPSELARLALPASQVEDVYPLSPMQQGMLFHSLYAPGSDVYVNQLRADVNGLDVPRFRAALQAAFDRHPILRTGFLVHAEGQGAVQVVRLRVEAPVRVLRSEEATPSSGWLDQHADDERRRGFDLTQPPLQRILLIETGPGRHHLIWTHHHLLLDGWSNAMLIEQVLGDYLGELSSAAAQATELGARSLAAGRYRDYIAWLAGQDAGESERFWGEQLATLEQPTLLASSLPRPSEPEPGYGRASVTLGVEQTRELRRRARELRVTLNTLVQGAWLLLLQRCTGQRSVAFGATVAGRPASMPGSESLLGLFINTLPVVQSPAGSVEVGAWLRQLQDDNLGLREHEHTPLYEIQRWCGRAGQPLFDTVLVFENYPVDQALRAKSSERLRFDDVRLSGPTHYPLTLGVMTADRAVAEEQLGIVAEYARQDFTAAQVAAILNQLEHLLLGLARGEGRRLGELGLLGHDAQRALFQLWNGRRTGSPGRDYLHGWLAEEARRRPEAIGLVAGERRLSYREMWAAVRGQARVLRAAGAGPDAIIGIHLPRSAESIIAMLAILEAGAAFVSLDPGYPSEHLRYIVRDARLRLVVTGREHEPGARALGAAEVLCLDALEPRPGDDSPLATHERPHPEHLAYLIYTSGSTGKPKGVAVSRAALSMHCSAIGGIYQLGERDVALHMAALGFDAAVEQLFVPLLSGARVVLGMPQAWSTEELCAVVESERISLIYPPTGPLAELASHVLRRGKPLSLRWCCVGGEAVPHETVRRIREAFRCGVINGYGPTETVITPLLWQAGDGDPGHGAYAPIGRSVGDRSIYVLDRDLNPVPAGVVGELYIGGAGSARGYLDKPGLTADRFVPDPFDGRGGRLYRTGDLVRSLADGVIEFISRVDHQVKIRGYRIELGEIEQHLRAHPLVRDAVVVARRANSGAQQLVGYVAAGSSYGLSAELRERARQTLPEYMVPAQVVVLDALPLTRHGKVDRNALPDPELPERAHVEPESELARAVAQIWREVLAVERMGLTDSFFELGGHSVLALEVLSRIKSELHIDAPLSAVFKAETLGDLVQVLETQGQAWLPFAAED